MDTSELEKLVRLELGRRHSRETVNIYAGVARQLAGHAGKTHGFKRRDILLFIDDLIDSGKSSSYIAWTRFAIKAMFRAIEETCPVTVEDFPQASDPIYQPTMLSDRVKNLIIKTNAHGLPYERFYLLMSTVYGLRRVELSRLSPSSFDDTVSHVAIDTAKHGKARVHVIPEDIRPLVRVYLNSKRIYTYAPSTLSGVFIAMCNRANCHRGEHEGWHSIRRALNTGLLTNGANRDYVRDFMRWKASRRDMSEVYFHEAPAKIDRVIFEHHPFLPYWLGK